MQIFQVLTKRCNLELQTWQYRAIPTVTKDQPVDGWSHLRFSGRDILPLPLDLQVKLLCFVFPVFILISTLSLC